MRRPTPPNAFFVPAIRRVDASTEEHDYCGKGIIRRLAQLESPAHDSYDADRARFDNIQEFARDVIENPDVRLTIPHARDTINVHMDGRILPIESLGTGISEVIILGAAATLLESQAVCIEEPEIHLHPRLQRKLLAYLRDRTSNQYFIASHSGHIIDTPGASVFHVRLVDGATEVALAQEPSRRFEICTDLGYRASDLLQTNCIIWVEGPSDRIYLIHWLSAVDDELVEGIDYTIMFYGGRLLSHLSANDPEVEEFISLRRINRNIAIVIDSDKRSSAKPINATKQRVVSEIAEHGGIAWVTAGREIENYIDSDTFGKALASAEPTMQPGRRHGRYDDLLRGVHVNGKKATREPDKMKLARAVASLPASLNAHDLRERIETLARFIHAANHRHAIA